jgi:hypothetical protein
MNTATTRTGAFDVRVADALRCPHCGTRVSPHAIAGRERSAWQMICQDCHRDLVTVEPAE